MRTVCSMAAIVAAAMAPSLVSAADPGLVAVGKVLWSGFPDGLESASARAMELAPDGRGFLYYQGAPWPRVMFLSVEEKDAQPRMVGKVTPFLRRRPRFHPSGSHVFFTALDTTGRLDRSEKVPVRTHVVRVALSAPQVEYVHPPKSSSSGALAVFFDIHPHADVLLVGTCDGLDSASLASGEYFLEAAEIPATGGALRPLRFQVRGTAEIRYTRDGKAILYTGEGGEAHRYDRVTGRSDLLDSLPPDPAGEREVTSVMAPHLGSFGWDAFPTHVVLDELQNPTAAAPMAFPPEVLAPSGVPPRPVSLRAGRVLLEGGVKDQPLPVVADAPLPRGPGLPWSADTAVSVFFFEAGLGEGRVLAAAEPSTEPILREVAASLEPGERRPAPIALFAKIVEKAPGGGKETGQRLEVVEMAPGYLRIDRYLEADSGTETFGFDGRESWFKTREGQYLPVEPAAFCREINARSLYRLLLDPAGLGDRRVRFGSVLAGAPGARAGHRVERVPFSYADGYRGELRLEAIEGRLLPVSIRTPLLFETDQVQKAMGKVPGEKSVAFEDWREWQGRLVPYRIRFDDGLNARIVEITSLEARPAVAEAEFRSPDRTGK